MEIAIGIGIGLPLGFLAALGLAIARSGSLGKAFWGMSLAGRANQDAVFAEKLAAVIACAEVKKPEPPKPVKPSGAPLRMLALLQAEARLVDFLLEDIAGFTDKQVADAVREVHKKAQAALKRHAVIEQILPGTEGEKATVQKGFDPSAVRVVGNVTGEPPFTGEVQHVGLRVKELKLAAPPEGADEFVLQPAEVQIG